MTISTKKKVLISLFSAVLFIILSLPIVYEFTNNLFTKLANVQTLSAENCPTIEGIIIHGLVFAILTLLSMYLR